MVSTTIITTTNNVAGCWSSIYDTSLNRGNITLGVGIHLAMCIDEQYNIRSNSNVITFDYI